MRDQGRQLAIRQIETEERNQEINARELNSFKSIGFPIGNDHRKDQDRQKQHGNRRITHDQVKDFWRNEVTRQHDGLC
jgi:hypothetical protein